MKKLTEQEQKKRDALNRWRAANREKWNEYQREWAKSHPDTIKASYRAWKEKNKEHVNAYMREWWAKNKERLNAKKRESYQANKEKVLSRTKAYQQANSDKIRLQKQVYYVKNKNRVDATNSEWKDTNRDYWNSWRRERMAELRTQPHIQRRRHLEILALYNLTSDDFDRFLIAQSGRCAICECVLVPKKNFLCIDHDHETGEVRGLLCNKCNNGLGMFEDDYGRMMAAAEYVWKYKWPRLVEAS